MNGCLVLTSVGWSLASFAINIAEVAGTLNSSTLFVHVQTLACSLKQRNRQDNHERACRALEDRNKEEFVFFSERKKEKRNLTMHQLATLPSDRFKKKLWFDGYRNVGPFYLWISMHTLQLLSVIPCNPIIHTESEWRSFSQQRGASVTWHVHHPRGTAASSQASLLPKNEEIEILCHRRASVVWFLINWGGHCERESSPMPPHKWNC